MGDTTGVTEMVGVMDDVKEIVGVIEDVKETVGDPEGVCDMVGDVDGDGESVVGPSNCTKLPFPSSP